MPRAAGRLRTGMKLKAEACDGEEAIEKYRFYRPEITPMDIQMPNMNGVDAITRIRDEFSGRELWF